MKKEAKFLQFSLLLISILIGLGTFQKVAEASPLENPLFPQTRSIIGTDNRIRVTNTAEEPYNSNVFIAANGAAGSGVVIGKNTVLTAAHVVRNIKDTPDMETVYVIPGRDGAKLPYGKFKIKSVHIPQSYIDSPSIDRDIAVLTIEPLNGVSIGEAVPALPIRHANDIEPGADLATTGYPGDKPWGTMWTISGNEAGQTGTRLYFDMDVIGGQSGSPIYDQDNFIVGVVTTSAKTRNFGTKLNDEFYQFVLDNLC